MYPHHPAPVLANPFSGRHPRAVGLPWWGGALLAFAVVVPPLAGQPPRTVSGQAEPRINFPNSLAPQPRGARVVTGAQPIADTEPVSFQIAFRMERGVYPAAPDYLAVVEWLKAQGFTTTSIDPARRMSIDAQGTVAQARTALNVQFERVEVGGDQFIAAASVPSLPASVGRAVLGINGLQPFLHLNKGPLAVPLSGR